VQQCETVSAVVVVAVVVVVSIGVNNVLTCQQTQQ
jgi:hypothetical protein